ncbi:T9SS type A sorting domain-containing protein [Hymenobacter psychrophilus]|uniref:Delta-60 repeat domain-containing protein/Por secretion system C-terminal sorting domain-containing protein n=1 Tax=Hymenobacter psychrophilus TaxID=651662 RepID=A0A1H3LMC1_9BACT|nr:T9SS type A sorting domain-containing protein [Hymenobacter psychrophilus]SDY65561.1 delta-60 repeat domain-containing protein/Por secretion system C-terminal sorting domain-containing protein [Hymenobacter psychrophilus]
MPVANGKVLIGGSFSEYNGFVCNGLARLNADGSFDTSFTSSLQSGSGVNNLAVQPNGRILVLGYLTTFSGGSSNSTALVRLFDNGALDNSFAVPTTIATDFNMYSYYGDALVVQNDGKILVISTTRRPLTRLNANGTLDLSYTSPAADPALPSYSLTLLRNGQVLAAGAFTSFAGTVDQPLVRVNTSGSLDAAFTPNIQLSGTISVVARQADGKLVAGGNFSEINGQPVRRLARFNSDGTLDAAFIFNTGNALNLTVSDLVLQPNGAVLATNGPTLYRYLPNGSRDNGFAAPIFSNPNFSGLVNRVLLQADGRILVGGNLNSTTGSPATSAARLTSTGSYDPTFMLPPNTGSNGIFLLYSMALQPDGKLLIGARFRDASGGSSSAARLVRYTANGNIDPTFTSTNFTSPSGNSIGVQLRALILQADGKVLAAGTVNTATGPLTTLSRLNPNGSPDTGFAPPVINGYVYSLAVQPNNRILVGGRFTSPTAPSQLARLLPSGNVDASFGPTAVPNGAVSALLAQPDGTIIIGGQFTSIGGQPSMALSRLVAPNVLHVKAPAAVAEQTTAWPVPAHTQLHVALAPTAHAQLLELLDALGRPVRQQPLAGRQTTSLALEGLPAGIYLLRVTYAEGIVTRRVQVQ